MTSVWFDDFDNGLEINSTIFLKEIPYEAVKIEDEGTLFTVGTHPSVVFLYLLLPDATLLNYCSYIFPNVQYLHIDVLRPGLWSLISKFENLIGLRVAVLEDLLAVNEILSHRVQSLFVGMVCKFEFDKSKPYILPQTLHLKIGDFQTKSDGLIDLVELSIQHVEDLRLDTKVLGEDIERLKCLTKEVKTFKPRVVHENCLITGIFPAFVRRNETKEQTLEQTCSYSPLLEALDVSNTSRNHISHLAAQLVTKHREARSRDVKLTLAWQLIKLSLNLLNHKRIREQIQHKLSDFEKELELWHMSEHKKQFWLDAFGELKAKFEALTQK